MLDTGACPVRIRAQELHELCCAFKGPSAAARELRSRCLGKSRSGPWDLVLFEDVDDRRVWVQLVATSIILLRIRTVVPARRALNSTGGDDGQT